MKYLFLALVFFLPTQLGVHFWPNFAFINGVRIDYFAPTIYFTDILIVMLAASSIYKNGFRTPAGMTLVVLFALINIYFSISTELSIYKWLKVLEFVWLGLWIKTNFQKSWEKDFVKVLSATIFFQSFLAFGQVITQRSLGGIFYWFGERTFSAATPGIAQAVINGELFLRPYGTFSHPNVLAAFLFLSIIIIYRFRKNISKKLLVVVLIVASATILLTISRLFLISLIIFLLWILVNRKLFFIILVFGFAVSTFYFLENIFLDQSFQIRENLVLATLNIIQNNFIFGTGLGTNILALQNYSKNLFFNSQPLAYLQPVHNIFLLVLSEVGILGLLLFFKLFFKKNFLIFVILFLGLFDHYFLTVQQGQLLLVLILGIIYSCQKS
ncbi:MAG: O-antigen ligase family protein [bacterium]|nr:O-antigen ligase family protein [bacterium]